MREATKPLTVIEFCDLRRVVETGAIPRNMDPLNLIDRLLETVRARERELLAFTRLLDEHPEAWEGPCECALCRSYAAEDRM